MAKVQGRQVAHLWANQSGQSAEGFGSTSFRGDTLFSYREPIGQIVSAHGRAVALFRNRSFSVTTSKHQSWMRGAACHLASFTVENIAPVQHGENLKDYRNRIESLAGKRRARASKVEAAIVSLIEEANQYAETFGLATRFSADNLDEITQRAKERAARELSRDRKREAEWIRKEQVKLSNWLQGEPGIPNVPTQYARVEGENLVTTMGAIVPVSHVQRVRGLIQKIIQSGQDWKRNGETIRVGEFQIDSITPDGTLTAGCHTFERSEVERILSIV